MATEVHAGMNYVDGDWRPPASGLTYDKRGPLDPTRVLAKVAASDRVDMEAATTAAVTAQPAWARTAAAERSALLLAAADRLTVDAERLAATMVDEVGKPIREARAEVKRGAEILQFFAGEALRAVGEVYERADGAGLVTTRHRPVGVFGLITPWNFPVAIPLWKAAPALAYGNSVVLKLASDAPMTGLHLAACFAAAGAPPGTVNVLTGAGSKLGPALVEDPRVSAISFTGSAAVGRELRDAAAAQHKAVQLELGGHSPLVVMADADLDAAAEAAFGGAFFSAGQKCTATRRILVQSDAYDEFRDRLVRRMRAALCGDPMDAATEIGALVSPDALDATLAVVEQTQAAGGVLLAGGTRLAGPRCMLAPTLFEDVPDDCELACEEVFGPVASLVRFSTFDDMIEQANRLDYGLSAAIFTRDLDVATAFSDRIEAGVIRINGATAGADVHVPFGGLKGSAYGPHEQGRAAREFFTESVTVYH